MLETGSTVLFPLVIPIDEENQIFSGYIPIHNDEYLIRLEFKSKAIYGSAPLSTLLKGHEAQIQQLFQQSSDAMAFLVALKELVETISSPKAPFYYSSKRYASIIQQLQHIGFDNIHSLNDTLTEIIFQNQNYLFKTSIPPTYPTEKPIVSTQLPEPIVPTTSLKQLVDQFTDIVERYHDLFACLDELDGKMRILEPEMPKRSDTWRLIGLGHHCSVHIELDKHQPRHQPSNVRFFGNQARVKGLKATWQSSEWDESQTPWHNIQRILQGVVVEHKKQDYTQVGEIECGICYFYKLHDGTIPDIICTNELCSRSYHPVCLSEWLKSNPDTLQQFDLLFGKCPYCQEKIMTKAIL